MTPVRALRYRLRELRELGLGGSAFRVLWELQRRGGVFELLDRPPTYDSRTVQAIRAAPGNWRSRLWFARPEVVNERMGPMLDDSQRAALSAVAEDAARGNVLSFSHEVRNCGDPIQWHRDPVSGEAVDAEIHWGRALRSVSGDVKDLWEMGRFPHAFAMARAATFEPSLRVALAGALAAQIEAFIEANHFARGVHWASGQEIAFRLFAWTFALPTLLLDCAEPSILTRMAAHFHDAGVHIARHVDYARRATYNNHLLSEAVALLLVAHMLPGATRSPAFWDLGRELFDEGVRRQFYADGGYIQQAHNYHRVALHDLRWATAILRAQGEAVPSAWRDAGLRSVEFLRSQQAPDGSLPNYGNNDGALVCPLTACSYDDYRPVLQATHTELRGERIFSAGPWDEEAMWFLGGLPDSDPGEHSLRSQSFSSTGHHVLRASASTFALFRCGTVRDRFTQMDMLHVDIFWRGHNVIVDPGSYRYNGAPEWHAHFQGTASHNTVVVDGENQMVHLRQFKMLYPTPARLLEFRDEGQWRLCAGEHFGYHRLGGQVTHRRAVLSVAADLWVVVDTLEGDAQHTVRLHWLLGDFPRYGPAGLATPSGVFEVAVFDDGGDRCALDVVVGGERPIRGWLSRRYAHKAPVPSVAVERAGRLPLQLVTVLGAGPVGVRKTGQSWRVNSANAAASFGMTRGIPTRIDFQAAAPPG
jgi:hypothetical protein